MLVVNKSTGDLADGDLADADVSRPGISSPDSDQTYSDVPPALGKPICEYRIAPGDAHAYPVKKGQYVQIIDVEGSQCSDFLAFAGDDFGNDYGQTLESTVTRTLNGTANPRAGLHGKYFSQTMQPLVEVIRDTCDRHDSFLLACTSRYYEDAGYPGHPSCSENFNRILANYNIPPRPGWPAINFFFNTQINCDRTVASAESWSRPGDYVLLKAHQDLLCASSACPDDIDPANNWQPTPIHIRIYAADESFEPATGRRVAADLPICLTQESAFTASIRSLTDDLIDYNSFWVPNSFAYQGAQAEYWALRQRAALMDLSALRKFEITGVDAFALLQYAFSRNLEKVSAGRSAYGCLLNPHGGIVDDGIVFCFGPAHYRYVGNCDTDGAWLRRLAQQQNLTVTIENTSDRIHNLALQGPASYSILKPLLASPSVLDDLGHFRFKAVEIETIPVLLSRTGYTGELGYELFVHPRYGSQLWDILMKAGKPRGLLPLGMHALDIARIEAGLLARDYEFNDLISPYQAGIGWTVALKKSDLIGKAALESIRRRPPKVAVGLVLEGNEVAACGQNIYAKGERWRIGQITSATFSPILRRSIAMAQVVPEFAQADSQVEVGLVDGFKRRVVATVGPLAAFDPTKSRARAEAATYA